MDRVYLCLAHMSGNEMKYIQEAFDTNWVVPLGPNVNAFEDDLEAYVGQGKKVVALASGTAAVHLAMVALGIGPGDEVICQSFTFAASCNPTRYLASHMEHGPQHIGRCHQGQNKQDWTQAQSYCPCLSLWYASLY